MAGRTRKGQPPTREEFRWAIVRLILGQVQMVGATVGFFLLVTTGVNAAVLGVVAVTTLATIVSKLLFRKSDRCEGRDIA